MSLVNIRIHGHDYQLACDDGQEGHLRQLADEIDNRIRALSYRAGGNPGEVLSLLLVSLTMADELLDNKRELARLSEQVAYLTKHPGAGEVRAAEQLAETELQLAIHLEEVAARIEKIAAHVEMQ